MAKKFHAYVLYGQYLWYAVACVIATLAIVNVIGKVIHRHQRLSAVSRLSHSTDQGTPKSSESASGVATVGNATFATYQNIVHLTTLPARLYSISFNELFWTIIYAFMVLFFGFYKSNARPKAYANQIGYIAFTQIPLIVGLAGKNNTISWMTGIGYEKLNFLHRAAGRVCLVASWVHAFGRVAIGLKGKTAINVGYMRWGVAALVLYTLLTFTSFRPVRNRFYETFLISHILLVFGFLLSLWLHWDKYSYWIYPGFILWGLDRFVRLGRMILLNKLWLLPTSKAKSEASMASVELLGSSTLRVTLSRPGLRWSPGQHGYLMIPSVALFPFEAHPFTMTGMPDASGQVTFIMKTRDGFTRRLKDKVDSSNKFMVPAYVEGSYGNSESALHNDTVLLVTGGSGVTFSVSHIVNIVREVKAGKAAVRKVILVWMMRSPDCLEWIETVLSKELVNMPASLSFEAHLHLTKSASSEADLEKLPYFDSSTGSSRSSISGTPKQEVDNTLGDKAPLSSAIAGKPSSLIRYSTWHVGRADMADYLGRAVKECQGPVAILVCGPGELQASTRRETKRINKAGKILKGQQAVTYHAETFGW